MAHELEQFSTDDGTTATAFFSARTDAWHQLGTVTTECLTAAEVMQVAFLGGCYADAVVMPSRCGLPSVHVSLA